MLSSREEIQAWLIERIAREVKITPDKIGTDVPFARFGLDSIVLVTLVDDLEHMVGISLDPTIFWEFPTNEILTNWLVEDKLAIKESS